MMTISTWRIDEGGIWKVTFALKIWNEVRVMRATQGHRD